MSAAGTLYLVSTPIGNLGDVTYRAIEVLGAAETILAEDTRRTRILLERYDVPVRDIRSLHRHNEAARTDEVGELLVAGGTVALVTDSGTPLVSDPGQRLVRAALELGSRVVPVPGPSAALAALVASGLEVQPFTFLGFVPRSGKDRGRFVETLGRLTHTAVFFESPHRLVRTLEDLVRELGGGRQVAVAREVTKVHEEFIRGTLDEAEAYYREHEPRGEIVVCLAGGAETSEEESEDAVRILAGELARQGATSKEIVRALRDRYGIDRNRAYALALAAAEEVGS